MKYRLVFIFLYISVLLGKSDLLFLEIIPYLCCFSLLFCFVSKSLLRDTLGFITLVSSISFVFGEPLLIAFAYKSTFLTVLIYCFFKYFSRYFLIDSVKSIFLTSSLINISLIFLQYFSGIIWVPSFLRYDGVLHNARALRPIGLLADPHASAFLNCFFIIYIFHLLLNKHINKTLGITLLLIAFFGAYCSSSYTSLIACVVQLIIFFTSSLFPFLHRPILKFSRFASINPLFVLSLSSLTLFLFTPLFSVLISSLFLIFDTRSIISIEMIAYQIQYIISNIFYYLPFFPSSPPEIIVDLGEFGSSVFLNKYLSVGLEIGWIRSLYSYGFISAILLILLTSTHLKYLRYFILVILFHYNHIVSNPLVFFYAATASFLIARIPSSNLSNTLVKSE